MIDPKKLKAKSKIKLLNGEELTIRGAYMSPTGLVITAKADPGSIVDRNVPLEDIAEVVDAVR